MFRHTAATEWLQAQVAPDVVQELPGHASQSTLLEPVSLGIGNRGFAIAS